MMDTSLVFCTRFIQQSKSFHPDSLKAFGTLISDLYVQGYKLIEIHELPSQDMTMLIFKNDVLANQLKIENDQPMSSL